MPSSRITRQNKGPELLPPLQEAVRGDLAGTLDCPRDYDSSTADESWIHEILNSDFDIKDGIRLLIKLQMRNSEKLVDLTKRVDKTDKWLENIEESLSCLESRIADLEGQRVLAPAGSGNNEANGRTLQEETTAILDKLDDLENRSRRNNICISGLAEDENETWEITERKVHDVLQKKLSLRKMDIERAHRTGRRKPNGSARLIVCKLSSYKDKELIVKNSRKLKGTDIYINEDYSARTREARAKLRAFGRQQKENGAKIVRLNFNKLIIDDKLFVYDFSRKTTVPLPPR